jgi:hypothetical protein
MLDVARLHVGGEAVDRVVGETDHFFLVLVGQDGDDRSKDLLAGDRHVVGDAREHRGTNIEAAVEVFGTAHAAGHQFGALVDAGLDQLLDLLVLRGVHDRAESGLGILRVADDELLGSFPGDLLDLFVTALRHEHAGGGGAGLSAVHHHAVDALGDGGLEIDVGQQDVGRLAAQFLGHALHGGRRGLRHADTGAGRAGERHHVDVGMRGHRLADHGARAVDHVVDTLGRAGGVHDLGPDHRVDRRFLGRLEHHGAAGGQGGQNLAGDLVGRPVPRRDQAAHADRLA